MSDADACRCVCGGCLTKGANEAIAAIVADLRKLAAALEYTGDHDNIGEACSLLRVSDRYEAREHLKGKKE